LVFSYLATYPLKMHKRGVACSLKITN